VSGRTQSWHARCITTGTRHWSLTTLFGCDRHQLGTCPKCGFATQRIPKRLVDRLMSRFYPVERHLCLSPACDWVGNIKGSVMEAEAEPVES